MGFHNITSPKRQPEGYSRVTCAWNKARFESLSVLRFRHCELCHSARSCRPQPISPAVWSVCH